MPRKSTGASSSARLQTPTENLGDMGTVTSATTKPLGTAAGSGAGEKGAGGAAEAKRKSKAEQHEGISIDDLLLPRSITSRIARGVLPPNTSLQKDAILALTKSATVFISYLASHANEQTSKKTIGPQDVLNAIQEIEMAGVMGMGSVGSDGRLGGRLERELEKFEEGGRQKRRGYREKLKARESGANTATEESTMTADGEEPAREDDNDGERRRKKMRRTSDGKEDGIARALASGTLSSPRATANTATTSSTSNGHAKAVVSPSTLPAKNGDETESDPDLPVEEEHELEGEEEADEDEVEEEDEEDDDDDEEADEDEGDEDDDDDENENKNEDMLLDTATDRRRKGKKGGGLAPNGRVELGGSSDEDEDDD